MKSYLDIESWPRREHFEFFRKFDEPFFGVTVNVDISKAYDISAATNTSFFLYYLHKTLLAANEIEEFKYRSAGDRIVVWDRIDASPTIAREDGSFGFSLVEYNTDFKVFSEKALAEIERVKKTPGLFTRNFDDDNLIHSSALPWIDFTSLSHARSFSFADSCPKISFGKITAGDSKKTMPMSVHVHHGLMDGIHVSKFISRFQEKLDSGI